MYANYDEIPADHRRIILQETGDTRVKHVPLDECNYIIEDYLREDSTLKCFTIEAVKDGNRLFYEANSYEEADLISDSIIEFGDRPDVVMVVKQNGRFVRGYVKGRMVYPTGYKGFIDVKRVATIPGI